MAAAVAAAETTRVAANGGNCCFSPVPGGGWTRLRWLPPGRAARDGRAAILEERRPRLPATCAPIGRRAGRGRLVTVSMAPARAGAEAAGAGPHATGVQGGRPGRGYRGRQGRGRGSGGGVSIAHLHQRRRGEPRALETRSGRRLRARGPETAAAPARPAACAALLPETRQKLVALPPQRSGSSPPLGERQVVGVIPGRSSSPPRSWHS